MKEEKGIRYLYYYEDGNLFMEEEGYIISDIFNIIPIPDELYGKQDFFDVGDDYERIERYESARASGWFF